MDLGLKGKVALVTGAGRDVGREIALALAAEGAAVAVNYNRSAAEATAVVKAIEGAGGKAKAYQADVTDYGAVKAMVDGVAKDLGGLDILINNAGFVLRQRFVDTTPEDWRSQIDVGLYGVIHACHAAIPHMEARKFGRIISFAGDSARIGESGLAVTAASRAGAIALSKSLAKELGRSNITVNMVSLGLIETSHSDAAWLDANREKIVRLYPLRRLGKPSDIAPMVAMLASPAAGWITGQVLSINGGFAMVG
jgi:NAD(P)-dependent dehydrogenase (short-subunit alcohol dehydrogenase family)